MMKTILRVAFAVVLLVSCKHDRKKDTISEYIRYIRRLPAGTYPELVTLQEVRVIKGIDSLQWLVADYSKELKFILPVDTVRSNIAKDILYNTQLLNKTNQRLDSLAMLKDKFKDDSFFESYSKSFVELKNFTEQQLLELKYLQYQLNKYHKDEDEILSRQIDCEYRLNKTASDSTKRTKKQTFFLSSDYKRVQLVR
ncbi:MAG: hypothetical protein JST69_00455 [Bacteroidetes bacterium]|nr:hypothetical protein [Bacteroidota bacterium]